MLLLMILGMMLAVRVSWGVLRLFGRLLGGFLCAGIYGIFGLIFVVGLGLRLLVPGLVIAGLLSLLAGPTVPVGSCCRMRMW